MKNPDSRAAKRKGNVKARRMYAQSQNGFVVPGNYRSNYPGSERSPVFVLPADAASHERMVERGALAIGSRAYRDSKATDIDDLACYTRKPEAEDIELYSKYARAVLAAIGLAAPRRKGRERA